MSYTFDSDKRAAMQSLVANQSSMLARAAGRSAGALKVYLEEIREADEQVQRLFGHITFPETQDVLRVSASIRNVTEIRALHADAESLEYRRYEPVVVERHYAVPVRHETIVHHHSSSSEDSAEAAIWGGLAALAGAAIGYAAGEASKPAKKAGKGRR